MAQGNDVIFREVQKFGLWFSVMLVAAVAGTIAAVYLGLFQEEAVSRGMFVFIVVVGVLMPAVISGFLLMLRLETEVRGDGLYVRFFPFHRGFKRFTRGDLQEHYACQYRPVREYGGWGIRYGAKGKAYNVSGKEGVQLVLGSGKRLLIGSQRAQELADAIDSIA